MFSDVSVFFYLNLSQTLLYVLDHFLRCHESFVVRVGYFIAERVL